MQVAVEKLKRKIKFKKSNFSKSCFPTKDSARVDTKQNNKENYEC